MYHLISHIFRILMLISPKTIVKIPPNCDNFMICKKIYNFFKTIEMQGWLTSPWDKPILELVKEKEGAVYGTKISDSDRGRR